MVQTPRAAACHKAAEPSKKDIYMAKSSAHKLKNFQYFDNQIAPLKQEPFHGESKGMGLGD
jgi:hypothetical protein